MDCTDARKHCQPFLDRELDGARVNDFEAHLTKCNDCAERVASQRAFNSLMKKVLANSSAPATLRNGVLSRLQESVDALSNPVPIRPHKNNGVPFAPVRGTVAAAACFMVMLGGMLGLQSAAVQSKCAMIREMQHEHANIVSGNRKPDEHKVTLAEMQKAAAAYQIDFTPPNLDKCELHPQSWGLVKMSVANGIFVKYVNDQGWSEAMTLMALNTADLPKTEKRDDFYCATYGGDTVVCWKRTDKGPLYVLVTKQAVEKALETAAAARK